MQHRKARELIRGGKPSGVYHYTTTLGDRVAPFGACAKDCPGHGSKEEAYEHERQRLIGEMHPVEYESWTNCQYKHEDGIQPCQEPAKSGWRWGQFGSVILCPQHNTREIAEAHVRVGESLVS